MGGCLAKRNRAALSESPEISVFQGDLTWRLEEVDCICAGVPCQDVSIAGKRKGLKGERTGLFFEFARILREVRPAWFVFENVPGLLSSNDGRDFAEVLRVLMVECGYGIQWRVLNSQYFGVAQRRSRLFIVGYFGAPCPAEVLFEPEGVPGSVAPRAEKATDIAVPLTSGAGVCGKPSGRRMEDDFNLAVLTASVGHHGHSSNRGDGINLVCGPLKGSSRSGGFMPNAEEAAEGHPVTPSTEQAEMQSLYWDGNTNFVVSAPVDTNRVRSFTGLPEGMDSARYRALGNAVTVQVAEWIFRRILLYENSQSRRRFISLAL